MALTGKQLVEKAEALTAALVMADAALTERERTDARAQAQQLAAELADHLLPSERA